METPNTSGTASGGEQESATPQAAGEVQMAEFPPLEGSPAAGERGGNIDMLLDLSLPVSIELGRTNMTIRSILDVKRGSIVEFDKLSNEPVDIMVNGRKMAEGEVVVIEKHFGVRITSLVAASERMNTLGH